MIADPRPDPQAVGRVGPVNGPQRQAGTAWAAAYLVTVLSLIVLPLSPTPRNAAK